MATTAELSENFHQGFDGIKATLYLASMDAKSNTASGMQACLRQEGIGSRSSGKERDETGLDYFLARYYSGSLGRFLSPDEFKGGPDDALTGRDITPPGPLPYANIGNPQSLNKYGYVLNNPLRFIDPDGHSEEDERKKKAAEEAKKKKEEQKRAAELDRKSKVVFGETSGLVPQKAQDAAKNASPWNSKSYDPKSAAELKNARTNIADIYERNKTVHSDSPSNNKIEKQVYQDCRDAAAGSMDQNMAGRYFFIRQDGVGNQQPSEKAGYGQGDPITSYGPFRNVGGGDVPRGDATYIDIYEK